MKRVLWILLLAIGTTWTQVQPAEVVVMSEMAGDGCCAVPVGEGCDRQPARGAEDCMVCLVCLPAVNFLAPASADTLALDLTLEARLDGRDEMGATRADPPLLTPPRRAECSA
jgi:hypothetical protein